MSKAKDVILDDLGVWETSCQDVMCILLSTAIKVYGEVHSDVFSQLLNYAAFWKICLCRVSRAQLFHVEHHSSVINPISLRSFIPALCHVASLCFGVLLALMNTVASLSGSPISVLYWQVPSVNQQHHWDSRQRCQTLAVGWGPNTDSGIFCPGRLQTLITPHLCFSACNWSVLQSFDLWSVSCWCIMFCFQRLPSVLIMSSWPMCVRPYVCVQTLTKHPTTKSSSWLLL